MSGLAQLGLGVGLLWAGFAAGAELLIEPTDVVLGRTEVVQVTLKVAEAPGTEDRPLRLSVNVGSFGEVLRAGPGVYKTTYVPPATRFPQVALVGVWREVGPDAPIDFFRIPMRGATKLAVTTSPRAQVSIEVGAERFGPVGADGQGKAVVSILVPPGVKEAVVFSKSASGGTETSKTVPVEVPPYNRLTAALVPHALVADGNSRARLEIFYDLGGADVPADRVRIKSSLGAPTLSGAERGRYVFRYVPSAGTPAKDVRFEATVDQDPQAKAAVVLRLGLPDAVRVLLRPPAKALPADGRSTERLTALVIDGQGLGLPGKQVRFFANDQPLAPPTDQQDGEYALEWTTPALMPPGGLVRFRAQVEGAAGPLVASANYQLALGASPATIAATIQPPLVPADGRTEAEVLLDVRDPTGAPVSNLTWIGVANAGQLSPVAELGSGRYRLTYVAPSTTAGGEPELTFHASSGTFQQSVRVPLRENPFHVLAGPRVGLTHSLGELVGPRLGLEAWVVQRFGSSYFGASLTAAAATTTQLVTLPSQDLTSRADLWLFPVAVRLSYELFASQRLSLHLGAGGVSVWARYENALSGARVSRWGPGAVAFFSGALAAGRGQVFAELSYTHAPLRVPEFFVQAGGLDVSVGYRFGVF